MQQEKFINYLSSEKRFSVHTITSYSNDINQFFLFLSEEYKITSELSEVNFQIVRSWIASLLEQGVTPRSVNRKISTLKTFFKFLIREYHSKNINPFECLRILIKLIFSKLSKNVKVKYVNVRKIK